MGKKIKRILICIVSVAVLIFLDQAAKSWATDNLMDREPIELIKGVLELHYLPNGNTGAAFGMLEGHQTLFMIIATVICLVLLYIIYNIPEDKKFRLLTVLFTLIIAGGIGNMIDRAMLNYVIDFIYISIINFPIFNVADMYVSVGTVLLVVALLFVYKEEDVCKLERACMPWKADKNANVKSGDDASDISNM